MRDISEIIVTQIRIYQSDHIPYLETSSGPNTAKIVEHFQFKTFQTEGAVHQFTNGTLLTKAGPIIVVAASLDPRRIIMQVKGRSADAEAFQSAFWKLLDTFRGRDLKDEPLIKTEETMCVATLDFDFMALVAQHLREYLTTCLGPRLSYDRADARSIELKSVAFTVKYTPNPMLEERGIALADKTLTIEPRAGTAPKDRRFFTTTPTDSETHIALVTGLEQSIVGG